MNQEILIDSDILVYKTAFSVECPIYVVNNGIYRRRGYAESVAKKKNAEVFKRTNIGTEEEVKRNLKALIKQISDDIGKSNHRHFLTSTKQSPNYRQSIATSMPYKGNRSSKKPYYYHKVRQILHEEYGAKLVHGQEADDQISIEQQKLFERHGDYEHSIIVTIDKDLRTFPGQFYHLDKRELTFVTPEQAEKNFYRQLLTGDPTDNIPGLTKILKLSNREEEADKLSRGHYLKQYDTITIDWPAYRCYDYIFGLYQKYGLLENLKEIGNLLWLRRYEGQLWSDDQQWVKI